MVTTLGTRARNSSLKATLLLPWYTIQCLAMLCGRQDPVECIISFICSSNNNISRITLMLEKLRRAYGELLLSVGVGGLVGAGLLENDTSAVRGGRKGINNYLYSKFFA